MIETLSQLAASLDRLHAKAVRNPWLTLFTAVNRGLLGLGFISAGLRKTGGAPFAPGIPVDHPIGNYFDAFWRTGEYYVWVGGMQVLAGVLLLIPATATLGAVLFYPIIANIFVLTFSLGFGNTTMIAAAMLVSCTYLLCWDYDRWKALLPGLGVPRSADHSRHLGTGSTLLAGAAAGSMGLGAGLFAVVLIEKQMTLLPLMLPVVFVLFGAVLATALVRMNRPLWLVPQGERQRTVCAAHSLTACGHDLSSPGT